MHGKLVMAHCIVALRQVWIMANIFLLCRNQLFTLADETQHQAILQLWPMEVRLTSKWSWQVLFIILLGCILHSPVVKDADLSSTTNQRKVCPPNKWEERLHGELKEGPWGRVWIILGLFCRLLVLISFPVHSCCTYLTNWKQKSCNLTSWRQHLFLFRSCWQLLKRVSISKNISGRYITGLFLSKHVHSH